MFAPFLQRFVSRSLTAKPVLRFPITTGRIALSVGTRSFLTARPVLFPTTKKKVAPDGPAKKTTKTTTVKKTTKTTSAKTKKATAVKEPKLKTKPKVEKPKRILKRDLKPPFKRPGTAWVNFLSEYVKKSPTPKVRASITTKEASQEFKKLSLEERQRYASPREQMEEYQKRKLEWYKSLPAPHRKAVVRATRRPGYFNSFTLFVKDQFSIPSTSTATAVERMKEIAEKYAALSDAEKDDLRQRAQELSKKKAVDQEGN